MFSFNKLQPTEKSSKKIENKQAYYSVLKSNDLIQKVKLYLEKVACSNYNKVYRIEGNLY